MRLIVPALLFSVCAHLAVIFFLPRSVRGERFHSAHVEVGLIEVATHEPAPKSAPMPRRSHLSPKAPTKPSSPSLNAPGAASTDVTPVTTDQKFSDAGDSTAQGAAARASALGRYVARIRAQIEAAKLYPPSASAREQEGTVTVGLTIAADGTLAKFTVEQPCAFGLLNEAALAAVGRMGPVPPRPAEIGAAPLHLHVPVVFRIDH